MSRAGLLEQPFPDADRPDARHSLGTDHRCHQVECRPSLLPSSSADSESACPSRLIANESAKKNLRKKLQLHVTGHSLGAGMATLCTARVRPHQCSFSRFTKLNRFVQLLETPGDVGPHVQYRDSYLFGTPRSLSGVAASRVRPLSRSDGAGLTRRRSSRTTS